MLKHALIASTLCAGLIAAGSAQAESIFNYTYVELGVSKSSVETIRDVDAERSEDDYLGPRLEASYEFDLGGSNWVQDFFVIGQYSYRTQDQDNPGNEFYDYRLGLGKAVEIYDDADLFFTLGVAGVDSKYVDYDDTGAFAQIGYRTRADAIELQLGLGRFLYSDLDDVNLLEIGFLYHINDNIGVGLDIENTEEDNNFVATARYTF